MIKSVIKLLILVGIFNSFWNCKKNKTDFVLDEFKKQIELQGLKIDSIDQDELIYIQKEDITLKVSLDNIRKNYLRDKDETIIADFAKTISELDTDESYTWDEVKNNIFISIYPNDYEFNDVLNQEITQQVNKIYVIKSKEKYSWVSKNDLIKWEISETELNSQAKKNADELVKEVKIRIENIDNRKLGFLETEYSNLKYAILTTPSFKLKATKEFNLPYYFVIPCRDFCFLFSKEDFNFFSSRIEETVLEEYQNSGYPFTTEIFEMTNSGINVVGEFKR